MDEKSEKLVKEITGKLRKIASNFVGCALEKSAKNAIVDRLKYELEKSGVLPNPRTMAVVDSMKFSWDAEKMRPANFYTALIMFLVQHVAGYKLPLECEVVGDTYELPGVGQCGWDSEKSHFKICFYKSMEVIKFEFTVSGNGITTPDPVIVNPLPFDPNPVTYRQMHEAAAGMGLEKIYFDMNNIDPDAPVRCNCHWDGGHEPNCHISQAHALCRAPQHRD